MFFDKTIKLSFTAVTSPNLDWEHFYKDFFDEFYQKQRTKVKNKSQKQNSLDI